MKSIIKYLLGVALVAQSTWAASDWIAPQADVKYDWRNTTWYGLSTGTISGPGLSVMHWGESQGFKLSVFPGMVFKNHEQDRIVFVGGAYMRGLNDAEAATAGNLGFTTSHIYWFVGGFLGQMGLDDPPATLGSMSGGIGIDLNRRDSRWSILLGIGPYYLIRTSNDQMLRIYPTFEIAWHFGVPGRIGQ